MDVVGSRGFTAHIYIYIYIYTDGVDILVFFSLVCALLLLDCLCNSSIGIKSIKSLPVW